MSGESTLVGGRVQARVAGPAARHHGATWVEANARSLIAMFALVAVALRLPYVWSGLSIDEGGYAYIARQWSRGARLYDTAWLDRPQGLLVTYRALLALGESGWAIRGLVVAIGAVMTLLVASIGGLIGGRRLAVAAAGLYAIVGVAPHIEGFTLNGELLATVPATAAVAATLVWRRRALMAVASRWTRVAWMVAAGLCAGVALTMKQSGFDGIVVGLVIVLGTRAPWPRRARRAAVFVAAFAVPVAACVLDGWSLGWSGYWNAIAGYQVSSFDSAANDGSTRAHEFIHSLPLVLWDIGALVVIAVLGLRLLSRFARVVLVAWLAAGFLAVNLGGSYWPHYYVQLLPPLVLAGAYAAVAVPYRRLGMLLAAILVVPALAWMVALVLMSSADRQHTIPYAALAARDARIAAAIDQETAVDQRIYVFDADPLLYFLSHRETTYRYLWGKPIEKIPAAVAEIRGLLAASGRPVLVILERPPNSIDPTGAALRELSAHYRLIRIVDGVHILRADSSGDVRR